MAPYPAATAPNELKPRPSSRVFSITAADTVDRCMWQIENIRGRVGGKGRGVKGDG
jgi:hypothetical protein